MNKWSAQLGCLALVLVPTIAHANTDEKAVKHEDDARAISGDDWEARMDIGGKFGFDMADFTGPGTNEAYVSYSPSLGICAGAEVGLQLTEHVALQAEFLVTIKGPHAAASGMASGTYSMIYFELPLLARLTLPIRGRIEYYAMLGPAPGFLLDADIDLTDGRHFDLGTFELLDIGVMLGAGAALELRKRGALTLDLRYNRGLLNISQTAASDDDMLMHQALYVQVGYRANLDDLLHGSRRKTSPPRETLPSSLAADADAAPSGTPAAEP